MKEHLKSTSFLESIDSAIIATDIEGRILFWNKFATFLYGYSMQEALGRTTLELISTSDSVKHGQEILQTLRYSDRWSGEYLARNKNNQEFIIHSIITKFQTEEGKQIGFVGLSRDITAKKKNNIEILKSKKLFHDMFNANPVPAFLWKQQESGKFLLAEFNVAANNLTQQQAYRFLNKSIDEVYFDRVDIRSKFNSCFTEKKTVNYESEYLSPGTGLIKIIKFTFLYLSDSEILVFTEDVTAQRNYEKQILQEKERAELADKLKTTFLATVSHEVRTPLNSVIGHIDLALNNNLSELQRTDNVKYLQQAKQSAYMLLSIIDDILDHSKIETGNLKIFYENVLLRNILDEITFFALNHIKSLNRDLKFIIEESDEVAESIITDKYRAQQILINLVSNAIKFSKNGSVVVRISIPNKDKIEFSVKDSGIGIPEKDIQNIFEPFQQVEWAQNRRFGGSGLGLAISLKLAKLMGGNLSVKSSLGVGSTFSLSLPYTPTNAIKAETLQVQNINLPKLNILVAEDDPVNMFLLTKILELKGMTVLSANNGAEAIEIFKHNPDVDLILMDIQMPIVDGITAIIEIQNNIKRLKLQNVPIIALSANAMPEEISNVINLGADEYLTKPIDQNKLWQVVSKMVIQFGL